MRRGSEPNLHKICRVCLVGGTAHAQIGIYFIRIFFLPLQTFSHRAENAHTHTQTVMMANKSVQLHSRMENELYLVALFDRANVRIDNYSILLSCISNSKVGLKKIGLCRANVKMSSRRQLTEDRSEFFF